MAENKNEACKENISAKRVAKNMVMVFFSNFATILSGVLVGFLVPKLMSVGDYGYYKTYTLYATYIGLFHFGFSDGIYTYFSGKNYNELNKKKFRKYSRFIILLELIFSVITILIGWLLLGGAYSVVFVFLGVNIFSTHITLFFQGIVQSSSRFKELSIKNLIQSFLNIAAIVTLYILCKTNCLSSLSYYLYLCILTVVNYLIAGMYFLKYREIVFGKSEKLGEKEHIFDIIKIGFPVLIGNLIGTLIMTIDRQFVSILFDNETYAVYAFAYNMLSLITVAISSLSIVLFPTLKQTNKENVKNKYAFMNSALLIFVFLSLVSYFILIVIVERFISDYIGSLAIFRVIFPGIALTSSITIIMYNVYKTFDMTLRYFIVSLIVLILSFLANLVAYYIFKTPLSISVASVIVIAVWYIVTESVLMAKFNIKPFRNYLYIICMITAFYLVTLIGVVWLGMLVYLAAWLFATVLLERKELKLLAGTLISFFKKSPHSLSNVQAESVEENIIEPQEEKTENSEDE